MINGHLFALVFVYEQSAIKEIFPLLLVVFLMRFEIIRYWAPHQICTIFWTDIVPLSFLHSIKWEIGRQFLMDKKWKSLLRRSYVTMLSKCQVYNFLLKRDAICCLKRNIPSLRHLSEGKPNWIVIFMEGWEPT